MNATHLRYALLISTLLIASCAGAPAIPTATTTAAVPTASVRPVLTEPQFARDPALVATAEDALMIFLEADDATEVAHEDLGGVGRDVIPVRYERGIEETIVWDGSGRGAAILMNEHGQVVYQVQEGGPAIKVVIPAGTYSLHVTRSRQREEAKDHELLIMGVAQEGLAQTRDFQWLGDSGQVSRGEKEDLYMAVAQARGLQLAGSDLKRAELDGASFAGADFSNTNFSGVRFTNVSLAGCNLTGAKFVGAYLKNVDFSNANLTRATISEAEVHHCSFTNANLTDGSLESSVVRRSNLRDANLSRTDLAFANLQGEDFRDAILNDTNFHRADLRRAKFWRAIATGVRFGYADLTGADLSWSVITGSDFLGTILTDADFSGASLRFNSHLRSRDQAYSRPIWRRFISSPPLEAHPK